MLKRISSGWIWLETALNAIIDEVNRQKPVASASIAVEESPNGSLLKVTHQGTGSPNGEWCQIYVKESDGSGGCVDKVLWYWGTPPADPPGPPAPSV
jgi:hypothetical protein